MPSLQQSMTVSIIRTLCKMMRQTIDDLATTKSLEMGGFWLEMLRKSPMSPQRGPQSLCLSRQLHLLSLFTLGLATLLPMRKEANQLLSRGLSFQT